MTTPSRCATLGLLALLGILGVGLSPSAHGQSPPNSPQPVAMTDDPIPLQRLLLAPEQLVPELDRVRRGILVQMPLADWEKRLRDLARKQVEAASPPRLIEAKYRAKLIDDHLAGTAEWKLHLPGKRAGYLSVEPLQLALRSAQWGDKRSAILDRFPQFDGTPGDLRLLVEDDVPPLVQLEWSARGVPEPGELRFSLRVPAAPLAQLELELPADRSPVLGQSDLLLTGPFPAESPQTRLWRIAFGSRTQLDLSLSRRDAPDQPKPLIRTRGFSRIELLPGRCQTSYELDIETLHGPISQLTLECDPRLQPYDVRINQRESWEILPNPDPSQPSRLVIKMATPFQGGRLEVLAFAPMPMTPDAPRWSLPEIQIPDCIDRGETIELRVHPELQLEAWNPGGYRLSRSDVGRENEQILTLLPSLSDTPNRRPRPSAVPRLLGTEVHVQQQLDWQIEADRTTLTTRMRCDVRRGVLSQFPVMIPPGWLVDSIEVTPRELAPTFTVQNGPAPLVNIELQRPLGPGQPNEWRITLRAPGPRFPNLPLGSRELPRVVIPLVDVIPLAARVREATLSIRVNGVFQATLLNRPDGSSLAPLPTLGGVLGSLGIAAILPEVPPGGTSFRVPYRGVGPTTDAKLLLRPRPLRLEIQCDQTVERILPTPRVAVRLDVFPESGSVPSLLIGSTSPLQGSVDWQVRQGSNRIAEVQPIPAGMMFAWGNVLAAGNPLSAAARISTVADLRGPWWRLRLTRPIQEPLRIEAKLTAKPTSTTRDRSHSVPLIWVAGVESSRGRIEITDPDRDDYRVLTRGLQTISSDVITSNAPGVDRVWSVAPLPLQMQLLPDDAPTGAGSPARLDSPSLLTIFDQRRMLLAFRVRLRNWNQRELAAKLPEGARLQVAVLNGRRIDTPDLVLANDPRTVRFSLPRSLAQSDHHLELVYEIPVRSWWFSIPAEAPVPEFVLSMPIVQREWRLAPGLAPMHPRGWLASPADPLPQDWPPLMPSSLRSWIDPPTPERLPPGLTPLLEAASPWTPSTEGRPKLSSSPATSPGTLGEWLARTWTQGTGAERVGLVVDTQALAEAGLSPQSPLTLVGPAPSPVWDALGLAILPCDTAVLLTTPRQRAFWETLRDRPDAPLPPQLQQAARDALEQGQDATGRFQQVGQWLESTHRDDHVPSSPVREWLAPLLAPDWTSWYPLPNQSADAMRIIAPSRLRILAWGIALVVLLTGCTWSLAESRLQRLAFLIGILTLGLVLQFGPLVAQLLVRPVFFVMLGIIVVSLIRHRMRAPRVGPFPNLRLGSSARGSRDARGSQRRILGIGFVLMLTLGSVAQPLEPAIVYLVPPTEQETVPTRVLVPRSLLQQIDAMEQRLLPNPGVVIESVHYEGQPSEGIALFDAQFRLRCFRDESVTLQLPLSGVQLRETRLDGVQAFPTRPIENRADPMNDRYALEIRGKGVHQLIVRFAVPILGAEIDREVRFGVPELPLSRLTFDVSGNPKQLQAMTWRGAQQLFPLPNGQRLETDLGRTRTVQIRWRQDRAIPTTALVRVQEVSQWEIDESTARLVTSMLYRITQGSITSFKIALPPGTEVGRIEIQPQSTVLASSPTSWLRDWSVTTPPGSTRPILTGSLQSPLSGVVRVHLELLPRAPLTNRPELEFPTAVEAAETDSYLAFRLTGIALGQVRTQGLSDFSADTFARDLWQPGSFVKSQGAPTRAFQRIRGQQAKILPTLVPISAPIRGTQSLRWGVGINRATVIATAEWVTSNPKLMFVEWDIPAEISIREVTGPGLRSWTRSQNRLQIWLQEPQNRVQMQVRGTVGFAPMPPSGLPTRLDLPCITLPGVNPIDSQIEIRPQDGIALQNEQLTQLAEDPQSDSPATLHYRTQTPTYTGRFTVWGPQSGAQYRMGQSLQCQDRTRTHDFRLDVKLAPERPHRFRLEIRDSQRAAPVSYQLTAPPDVRVIRRESFDRSLMWEIEVPIRSKPLPAGDGESRPESQVALPFQIVGSEPIDPRERELPQLHLLDTDDAWDRSSAVLLLCGPECRMLDGYGIRGLPPQAIAEQFPEWRERSLRPGSSAWRFRSDDWNMRILSGPSATAPSQRIQLGLMEMEAALDSTGWVYRARMECFHRERMPLELQLPPSAELLGFAIDGVERSESDLPNSPIPIPLPDEPGIRLIQIVWRIAAPQFGNALPDLRRPELIVADGILDGPSLVTVLQPAGERISRWSTNTGAIPVPISLAKQQIHRAESQLRLTEAMQSLPLSRLDSDSPRLIPTLVPLLRAERLLRLAEFQRIGRRPTPGDPQGEDRAIQDALTTAKSQLALMRGAPSSTAPLSLATPLGLAAIVGMDSAERTWTRLPESAAFERGLPITWDTPATLRIERFTPQSFDESRTARSRIPLLIGAGILGILAWLVLGQRGWPEQLAALGMIAVASLGDLDGLWFWSLPAVALIARLVILVRYLRRAPR
ncbi:hypothetical protein [Tuwongella immobilis]|uniref:Uncharacterized protein n=1 Tax=Tuwongella immobilis TaxID=692036 RepID=A0A6C2YUA1_9BACT|nr:hypothetical protein [Tuwongella immobilis]VIP04619.1 Uncharacterized protein OS=Planctomyces maris DSM 8797 GN=PM8797T_18334 PE=4 SV=1 [Tuwongella immobilis]VTS06599.1 Uncharacterized protein OS=Planctomyces maris DSM 8797 GN=PM8797T_18334 PE=4 SV=1 [Tuwongella immobilis]